MSLPSTVAIIGGGFSGAMTAVQLLRAGYRHSILLFESNPRIGRGIAYGTECNRHLLNVPAGAMSALPENPAHFLQWLQGRMPEAMSSTFAPRKLYGDYIEELFAETLASAHAKVEVIQDEVTSCSRSGKNEWTLKTTNGKKFAATSVVLASGHLKPSAPVEVNPALEADDRFICNPWKSGSLQGLRDDKPLLLIGSGLTAADVILEAQEVGFKGDIYLLSRRGFLPRVHALPAKPHAASTTLKSGGEIRSLVRALRDEIESNHNNWRSAIDSLRPETQNLWKNLGAVEQRRFLRHVRPYWEIHRHRIAPSVAEDLESAITGGKLHQISGRLQSIEAADKEVRVTYAARSRGEKRSLIVQRVINCTGPAGSLALATSPLIQQLLRDKVCRVDELGIGFDVDADGRTLSGNGAVNHDFIAMGSLRKGALWESTAIRELREQALQAAAIIHDLEVGEKSAAAVA
jgi:uncharacterized NAD(P)/FAD-binding protein YdhS